MKTPPPPKKKKVDYEAVTSPLNRIPGLNLATVRDLLDIGVRQVHELMGRSPEALLDEIQRRHPQTPSDRLAFLRLAVYYAETPDPEREKLHISKWL